MAWRDWIRTIEVEPSLYGADFARLGDQIEELLAAGCRIFHFDVGDGHFVEPITMGPIVLAVDRAADPSRRGRDRRAPDGREPRQVLRAGAAAGGDSVTFHYEAVDDVAATIRAAREHGLQAGVAFNPESEPEDVAAGERRRRPRALHGDPSRLLGAAVHRGDLRPRAPAAARARRRRPDPGGRRRRRRRTSARSARCGATLLVAATAIFGHDDLAGAYRRLVAALARDARTRDRARPRARAAGRIRSRPSAPCSCATARPSARA